MVERDRPVLSCRATGGLVSDHLQSFHNWSIVIMRTFDIGKLFCGTTWTVQPSITLMDFPYLIPHVFQETRDGNKLSLNVLRSMFLEYSKRYILLQQENGKEERFSERVLKTLESAVRDEAACPNGLFGIDGLSQSLKDLDDTRNRVKVLVSISNTVFDLRRLGDCVAVRPADLRGDDHQEAASILDGMIGTTNNGVFAVTHFVRQWGFSVVPHYDPDGNNGSIFNVADEIAKWRLHAPLIDWSDAGFFTPGLLEDFISSSDGDDGGVVVGSYGDMDVLMRIRSAKNSKDDMAWRRGSIRSQAVTNIVFEPNYQHITEVEYFLRVKNLRPCWLTVVPLDHVVDYSTEQYLMASVARMLYVGLYHRGYAEMIRHNQGNIQFLPHAKE